MATVEHEYVVVLRRTLTDVMQLARTRLCRSCMLPHVSTGFLFFEKLTCPPQVTCPSMLLLLVGFILIENEMSLLGRFGSAQE